MTDSLRVRPSDFPPSQRTLEHTVNSRQNPDSGKSARSAPITPTHRVPHIDRSQVSPETLQAAEGMEALFLDHMLKIMRETVPKNDMDLESPATGIYRGMLDSQFAQKAAHRGGIGLAEPLIDYLQSHSYDKRGRHDVNTQDPGLNKEEL